MFAPLLALAPLLLAPAPLSAPLAFAGAVSQAPATVAPAEPRAPAVLQRIAVIGASMSAGYGLVGAGDKPLGLDAILARALAVTPVEVANRAALMFFLDPEKGGAKVVDKLLEEPPSLVVGLDFLFWYAYGAQLGEAEHLARFDLGLAQLDRLECPILVADLPDMSHAVESDVPMLRASQVPAAAALKAMNARLAAWAKERPRVSVVPLADFTARMLSGEKLELRGNRWEDATERVLQPDLLHPSLAGTIGVVLLALDTLDRARADVTPEMVRWDAALLEKELGAER
jgi:hypothetical protein